MMSGFTDFVCGPGVETCRLMDSLEMGLAFAALAVALMVGALVLGIAFGILRYLWLPIAVTTYFMWDELNVWLWGVA